LTNVGGFLIKQFAAQGGKTGFLTGNGSLRYRSGAKNNNETNVTDPIIRISSVKRQVGKEDGIR
jgi:hypothetical protein